FHRRCTHEYLLTENPSWESRRVLKTLLGRQNGAYDLVVARTATQITRTPMSDLAFGCLGLMVQQRFGGHDETRCANAALQGCIFEKRFLQRMQAVRTN